MARDKKGVVFEEGQRVKVTAADGDYEGDVEFRGSFHRWLETLWEEKDEQIDALLRGLRASRG